MGKKLGIFKACNVRGVWGNESANFTPWLAEDENMALLGQALGLELEVESIEAAVGPYSADILAKETGSGKYVVIENQLGKTNHDHLGKLITYGSVLDAEAVVWLATEFTEEHQRALSWLNDYTTDALAFYGVLLEVWQIDDSRPAVRFNVISRPAGLKRTDVTGNDGDLSETKQLQLEFWTAVRDELLRKKVMPSARKPKGQYWYDVPLGRSDIFLSTVANTFEHRIGVRLYIRNKIAGMALPQLQNQKESIESELGIELQWDPNPDARDKVIAHYRDADISNRSQWDDYVGWIVEMISRFRKVFIPRVKKLALKRTPV